MLFTEAEALNHTLTSVKTFRRSLKLWEELYCPLPTDADNQKLIGKFLLRSLDAVDHSRSHDKRPKAERLEGQMTPGAFMNIAEDYVSSSARICGYEQFLLTLLQIAARRAYDEAWSLDLDTRFTLRRMDERLTTLEAALDGIQKWMRRAPRVVEDS